MPDYITITHVTRNEDGKEELSFERTPTLAEMAARILTDTPLAEPIKEEYVVSGLQWVDKKTGIAPDREKQHQLFCLKGEMKRQSSLFDL